MWPGPYGEWGSRKYLLASLDQSLRRMGLDYVDIFYSHRFDPDTPLEETLGALDTAVRAGKALYAGISSYSGARTREAVADPARARHAAAHPPAVLLAAQPLDRGGPARRARRGGRRLDRLLAARPGHAHRQVPRRHPRGHARDRHGLPERGHDRRAALEHVRALNEMAQRRGQTLAQMAIAWTLRDPRVTSSLIGARSVEQLEDSLGALATWTSPTTSWPRSTATPSRRASTSGRPRATPDGATVAAGELERWARALLEAAGLEPEAAATVAGTLVWTSVRGTDSHGVARLPVYVERLRAGVINTRPRPSVERRDGAIAVVDGDHGPGQVASVFATDLSVELAREHGVGVGGRAAQRPLRRAGVLRDARGRAGDGGDRADQHRAARDPVRRRRGGARHEPDLPRRACGGRRLQPRHGDQPGRDQPHLQRARRGPPDPRGLGRRRAGPHDDGRRRPSPRRCRWAGTRATRWP